MSLVRDRGVGTWQVARLALKWAGNRLAMAAERAASAVISVRQDLK
jgi:hypothetical protein